VVSIDFGEDISPYTQGTHMYDVIMNTKIDDPRSKRLVMLEAYDQTFKLFDHANLGHLPEHQMAVMRMHPAEDMATGNRLRGLMKELVACRIPELTNEPLSRLLQYPLDILEEYLVEGRKARAHQETVQRKLEEGLEP